MSELNMARVWIIFAYIICLASFMVIAESSNDNFIDPMDMLNFDSVNMRMKDKSMTQEPLDKTTCCSGEKCPPCNEASLDACLKIQGLHDTSTLLLRQYSMSLVKLMESKISSTSYPTLLDLRVRVTYHGLTKLRKFGEGSSSDFHALHETLTNFMQYAKPVSEESIFPRLYWLEDKLGLSFSMMAHITVLIISSLLLVVTISHLRLSKELVWRTLISVFFISVAMTMVEMYQGKVAEQEELLMTSARKHCPKAEEMSVWEKIFTYVTSHISFEDDDCKKYMEAILVNPLVTVNPLQAVAVAVVKTVVTPMEMIGQGIRNFLIGLLKGLPLQIQTFVLICLFCLLILWPLLLMGYNFNFCYLINIGPQRVVEKIQYVKSESCHRCDQLPSIELQNQALNSHDSLQTILRPVAIVSGNGNAMSPSIANKQGDLDFISREQSTEVTLSGRIEETKALDFHLTLGQHDGNDSYKKQLTDIQNCGAVKGKEPNSDLCHKMAQAAISESIPLDKSEDYEKDKSGSEIPAVNLAETSLSDRVQNLRLQEVEDSANTKIADAVYARKVQKTIVSNDGEIPDFLHIKVKSEKIVEKLPGNEEFGTCVNELRKED